MILDTPSSDPIPLSPAFAEWSVAEYLAVLFPLLPRDSLTELFSRGRVQSAGRPVGKERRVGDLSDLFLRGGTSGVRQIFAPGGDCGIEVIHEDDRLTVLAKPAGVPVIPARGGGVESILGYLMWREIESRKTKPLEQYIRPRIVHRIDRWTSGVVLVARTPDAERSLGQLFETRRVVKEYITLLAGPVAPGRVTLNCPLREARKGRMRAAPEGLAAETRFDVLERHHDWTLCVARPRTGRTHQIRVHAAAMGHALAIDPVYGGRTARSRPKPPAIDRLTLHAWRYSVPPAWGEPRVFTSPLPDDFRGCILQLRERAGA